MAGCSWFATRALSKFGRDDTRSQYLFPDQQPPQTNPTTSVSIIVNQRPRDDEAFHGR
jgi:hypothetical protein